MERSVKHGKTFLRLQLGGQGEPVQPRFLDLGVGRLLRYIFSETKQIMKTEAFIGGEVLQLCIPLVFTGLCCFNGVGTFICTGCL